MDYNSIVNQEIKSRLVERDVYICLTSEVEYILKKSYDDKDAPFCMEDVENFYIPYCSECGEGYTSFSKKDWSDMTEEEQDRWLDSQGYAIDDEDEDSEEMKKSRDTERQILHDDDDTFYICDDCGMVFSQSEYEALDTEAQEVYEWWAVSSNMGRALQERGEVIIPGNYGNWYWGRCTTGQAIKLDHVISLIAEGMEILDGQQLSWANQV